MGDNGFAYTTATVTVKSREAKSKEGKVVLLKAGDVYAMNEFGAFSHAVILGFDESGDNCKVSRPYCFASSTGTTGPTPLMGAETFEIPTTHLLEFWSKKGDLFTT